MSTAPNVAEWLLEGLEISDDRNVASLKAHVSQLFSVLRIPRRKYTDGIGPSGSRFISSQEYNLDIFVTTDEDPQEFFDKYVLPIIAVGRITITTNLSSFYCTRDGIAIDGGHFSVSRRGAQNAAKLVQSFFKLPVARSTRTKTRDTISPRLRKIVNAVSANANEETTKKDFVFPLCKIAGWHVDPDDGNDEGTKVEVEKYQPNRGRLDLLLKDMGVPRIVIECKKPSVLLAKDGHITSDGKQAMEQAHRYALGVRFWVNRCLPNILSVITNGKQALYFDSSISSFDDAFKTARSIDIDSESILQLYNLIELNRVRETDLSYVCSTRTLNDERKAIESSSTHLLSKHVLSWLTEIRRKGKLTSKEDALAMTLQLLFLIVARDHGILGSEEISDHVGNSNWDKLFEFCNRRFNSNVFEKRRPKTLAPDVLDDLYNKSKNLPFSLEAIPVEYVGDIYENLLHNLHSDEKHLSKTSYFTPQWLVREIVAEVEPTRDETVLDPTCGSAAFLCYTFEYVTRDMNFEQARKYLSTKIFGVDRDPLAVQVSRFALLVDLARKVQGDWREREHILPKLTHHIIAENFFTWQADQKFDVALGNPPWGSIDKEVLDSEIKEGLKDYDSYKDKTDVSIYVVEKAFDQLSKKGRLGFLVQRSTIDGSQHDQFREWWKSRIETVWDFGADELFAPRNKALTAVLLGRVGAQSKTHVVNRSSKSANKPVKIKGAVFSDKFHVLQGAQSACNDIYEQFALDYPKDKNVRTIVTPDTLRSGFIAKEKKALFIHPDTEDKQLPARILRWMKNRMIEKKIRGKKALENRPAQWWLRRRAEVVRKLKSKSKESRKRRTLGWLWLNGSEHYKFDCGQPRIFLSYYLNSERADAGIDFKGEMVGLTSTTVLIPKDGTSKDEVLFTLAWLNSKAFVRMQSSGAKMAAGGGRALYKEYIEPMLIPDLDKGDFETVVGIARKACSRPLSESDLIEIDRIFDGGVKRYRKAA